MKQLCACLALLTVVLLHGQMWMLCVRDHHGIALRVNSQGRSQIVCVLETSLLRWMDRRHADEPASITACVPSTIQASADALRRAGDSRLGAKAWRPLHLMVDSSVLPAIDSLPDLIVASRNGLRAISLWAAAWATTTLLRVDS